MAVDIASASASDKNWEGDESGPHSLLKEEVARQLREQYNFETTGNPQWDIGIGMAWREFKEMDEDIEPEEDVPSNIGGLTGEGGAAKSTKPQSKRQLKKERWLQRQRERRREGRREGRRENMGNLDGPARQGEATTTKSKRQLKRERQWARQRENASMV